MSAFGDVMPLGCVSEKKAWESVKHPQSASQARETPLAHRLVAYPPAQSLSNRKITPEVFSERRVALCRKYSCQTLGGLPRISARHAGVRSEGSRGRDVP